MALDTIYFSRFSTDENGGGGRRRTAQLYQLFSEELDCQFVSQHHFSEDELRSCSLNDNQHYSCWENNFINVVKKREKITELFKKQISYQTELVLLDDPLYFESLVDFCNSKNIAIIALVHNIESLVPGQVLPSKKKDLFVKEISVLQKCKAAITISREENLLLNNFGILSIYVPHSLFLDNKYTPWFLIISHRVLFHLCYFSTLLQKVNQNSLILQLRIRQ